MALGNKEGLQDVVVSEAVQIPVYRFRDQNDLSRLHDHNLQKKQYSQN
jgi:hypothetical protein